MRPIAMLLLTTCLAAGQVAVPGPYRPSAATLLDDPLVLADLGLDDAAKAALRPILAAYQEEREAAFRPPYDTPVEQRIEKVGLAFEERLRKHLAAGQVERLDQILTQQDVLSNGVLATLREAGRVRRWKITPDQIERWDALSKRLTDPLAKALTGGESADKIAARLAAIRKEFEAEALAVLTPEHRARWDAAFRRPFDFDARPSDFGRIAFKRHDLDSAAIQKALKLTPKQIDEVMPDWYHDEKALATLLTAEQIRRLGELNHQQWRRFGGPAALFRYRDVVEAVRPTAEQRARLEPLLARNLATYRDQKTPTADELRADDAAVAEILTAEQRATFQGLLGEPATFALPDPRELYRQRRRDQEERIAGAVMAQLRHNEMQKVIGMTPDQVEAMERLTAPVWAEEAKLGQRRPDGGRNFGPKDGWRSDRMQRALDLPLIVLLTPEQRGRYEQIQVQRRLWRAFPWRLEVLRDLVADGKLALTPADLEAVERVEKETRALDLLLSNDVPRLLGCDKPWWKDFWQETSQAVLRQVIARHDRALPEAARKGLADLTGKSIDLPGRVVRVFGGFAYSTDKP